MAQIQPIPTGVGSSITLSISQSIRPSTGLSPVQHQVLQILPIIQILMLIQTQILILIILMLMLMLILIIIMLILMLILLLIVMPILVAIVVLLGIPVQTWTVAVG
jgi:hypothetical protein